ATITVTISATRLSVNPVIQGSTDQTAARQGDHILTQVVTDKETAQFQANPTGTKQLPATAATASVTIAMGQGSAGAYTLVLAQGTEFDTTDGSVKFVTTENVNVTFDAW